MSCITKLSTSWTLTYIATATLIFSGEPLRAAEPTPISDLAIAMRYDEICSTFDESSKDKAMELLARVQRLGVDMSKLNVDDIGQINYGRGFVDGFHKGYSLGNGNKYKFACRTLRRELIDKL